MTYSDIQWTLIPELLLGKSACIHWFTNRRTDWYSLHTQTTAYDTILTYKCKSTNSAPLFEFNFQVEMTSNTICNAVTKAPLWKLHFSWHAVSHVSLDPATLIEVLTGGFSPPWNQFTSDLSYVFLSETLQALTNDRFWEKNNICGPYFILHSLCSLLFIVYMF